MKRAQVGILILLFLSPCFAEEAIIKYIPAREYFQTLIHEIEGARSSITAYMYHFSINLEDSNSQTLKIARSLIEAQKRGVTVEVTLDQNIDFNVEPNQRSWIVEGKNWTAYQFLTANDIPVYFDSPTTYIHSKVAVIDDETVLLGSTNWSQISLTKNIETNVLVRSKKVAEEILEDLSSVERQTAPREGPRVRIPYTFMEKPHLLGKMVTTHDTGGFDLYSILLKMASERGTSEFDVNYEELGKFLGLKGKQGIGYQRGMAKAIRRLEKKYNLIRFEHRRGKEGRVQLKDFENSENNLDLNFDRGISVSADYWNLGWINRLMLPGKVFYFLSLYESSVSPTKPQWSLSEENIAEKIHVSPAFITMAVTELRKANLIEVTYDTLTLEAGNQRPNIYAINPLYDPALLENGLKVLEEKYGKEKLARALRCAQLIYEDSSLDIIEKFIRLEERYGIEKINFVYKKLELKAVNNPKRSAGYFFNTVKRL